MSGSIGSPRRVSVLRRLFGDYLGLALVLAILVAVFGSTTQYFLTVTTFQTIANQVPDALVIAVGMTLVLIVGGIDLSVGSVLALGGALFGICLVRLGWPIGLAVVACLAAGLACGLVNGMITVRWALPSFIVTLGMLEIARGGAYLATNSQTIYVGQGLDWLGRAPIFGLSTAFLVSLVVVVVGELVLSRTVFGRYVVAIGTNEEAVRLSGVDPRPVKVAVFAVSGLLAAVAAVFHVVRLSASDPNAGTGVELQAIAAVVIGGTSLMGGRGSVVTSFFGVLIIAVLEAGLVSMGAHEPTKRLVTGCVIVAAVILDYYRHRLRRNMERSQ